MVAGDVGGSVGASDDGGVGGAGAPEPVEFGASCARDARGRVTATNVKRAADRRWRSRDFIQISQWAMSGCRPTTVAHCAQISAEDLASTAHSTNSRCVLVVLLPTTAALVSPSFRDGFVLSPTNEYRQGGGARRHVTTMSRLFHARVERSPEIIKKASRDGRRPEILRHSARSSPAPSPALVRALRRWPAAELRWRPGYDHGRR